MCTVDPQEPPDLVLAVSNRPTQEPVISDPRSTTKTTKKSSQRRVFFLRYWLLQRDSQPLLLGNLFYWHHGSLRFTNPKSETSFIVTPAWKHVSPLPPLSRRWAKPHATLTNLLQHFDPSCSHTQKLHKHRFRKENIKRLWKKHKGTDFSNASCQIFSILKSGLKLHKTSQSSISRQQRKRQEATANLKKRWEDSPTRTTVHEDTERESEIWFVRLKVTERIAVSKAFHWLWSRGATHNIDSKWIWDMLSLDGVGGILNNVGAIKK